MLRPEFYDTPDDRAVAREDHEAKRERFGTETPPASPRFVFRIEGSMRIYTDTVTGEEQSFHGAELGRAWVWKDAIVARERAERKQEAA